MREVTLLSLQSKCSEGPTSWEFKFYSHLIVLALGAFVAPTKLHIECVLVFARH